MGKSSSGAAAGGGAIYGLGILDALFYYWQKADAFWEYIWAIFPKAIFWPAFMVYGFHVSSCVVWCRPVPSYGRELGITVIDGGCPLMFDPCADPGHKAMRFIFTMTGKVPRSVPAPTLD